MPDKDIAWYRARWFRSRLMGAACSYCEAEVGEVCITAGGQEYPFFHAKRWKLTRRSEPMADYFLGLSEDELLQLDATVEIEELASKYPEPAPGSDDPRNPMCPYVATLAIRTCAARAQRRQTLEAVRNLSAVLGGDVAVQLVARQLDNEKEKGVGHDARNL